MICIRKLKYGMLGRDTAYKREEVAFNATASDDVPPGLPMGR